MGVFMYIWVGIDVDSQLWDIKHTAYSAEKEIGFKNSNFTLPLHISLKISFPVDDGIYLDVVQALTEYFKTLSPFEICVKGIENETSIVWIRMSHNETLNKIHDKLNSMLLDSYGVGLHEYDGDYKFHTTLFMEDNNEKTDIAYDKVKNIKIPEKLIANKFVIGISDTGALGTYRVFRTVKV